jgi:UDP-4-amino-4,6-dideoxy-N-acetyl-beta-L-altrosamine transaminase
VIPYGRHWIDEADVKTVVETLTSDFLTQGPAIPRFEAAATAAFGASHAVATSNATAALHIACLALELGPGDRLWTSPITFVASANAALYCGAEVDFVDIDHKTWNMSVDMLAAKLEAAEREGRLPRIVMPVHLCGQPCDMRPIADLAARYGFKIIEDASHAVGARYANTLTGDGRYSDITVFSFHPVKIITTGEGGMALANDPELARRMALLRSHGVTRDETQMEGESDGPWYYEQVVLGFNYRMTDLQAALGASQLTRLEPFLRRRRELAARYDEAFADIPLVRPFQHPETQSSWHLYVVRVASDCHRAAFEELRARGIGVNLHYIPIYRQPHYRRLGFEPGLCPEAERYYSEAITLPLFPAMTDAEQDQVISAVREVLAE